MSSGRPGVPSGPGASDVPRRPRAETLDPAALADLIRKRIRDVPDYPQPGISFKDITPMLADGPLFVAVVDELATGQRPVDKVAGIEARGFILAAPVANGLGAGFVPVRKAGKLPAATYHEDYQLEYGTAFDPGDRVLIVDDVLATGGTALATAELVRRAGGEVTGVAVLLELAFLEGRPKLGDIGFRALLTV